MGYLMHVRARYMGTSPTKNDDFFRAEFVFPEVYKGNRLDVAQFGDANIKILCRMASYPTYKALKQGHLYDLAVAVDVNQPKNGYRANVECTILEFNPVHNPELEMSLA